MFTLAGSRRFCQPRSTRRWSPPLPLPLLLPIRPVTSAIVAVSVASGLAAGLAAGGLLLVAAAMTRRA